MAVRYHPEYECGVRLSAAMARIEAEKHLKAAQAMPDGVEREQGFAMHRAAAAVEQAILEKIGASTTAYRGLAA